MNIFLGFSDIESESRRFVNLNEFCETPSGFHPHCVFYMSNTSSDADVIVGWVEYLIFSVLLGFP